METEPKKVITVEVTIEGSVEKIWDCWTKPEHITQWNFASAEWHTPSAVNNLWPGGNFTYRMEAKVGTEGFDFCGTYDEVKTHQYIAYTLADERKVEIFFKEHDGYTSITENFEPESENTIELQQFGWQAILNNFKRYVETQ